jgi:hypothetical protein
MAWISGLVVARIASRQRAAFCFQGVRMGQTSVELVTYPLKARMLFGRSPIRARRAGPPKVF